MAESGATRKVRPRRCNLCNAVILLALDGDICALEARVDPTPLTELGEALALLEGGRTYNLRREGPRFVLDPRDSHQITWAPATSRTRMDVLRAHRCHADPPAGALVAPTSFVEAHPRPAADAAPTF